MFSGKKHPRGRVSIEKEHKRRRTNYEKDRGKKRGKISHNLDLGIQFHAFIKGNPFRNSPLATGGTL